MSKEKMELVIKKIIKEIEYTTPEGNTNCRFCDNNLDDLGTFEDMHNESCIIHDLLESLRD